MSPEELRRAALFLFGPERGWQSRLARALGVNRAAVTRWLSGSVPVPGPVTAAVTAWLRGAAGKSCWPPDPVPRAPADCSPRPVESSRRHLRDRSESGDS